MVGVAEWWLCEVAAGRAPALSVRGRLVWGRLLLPYMCVLRRWWPA